MHSPRNTIRQYPPSPPLSHSSHDSNESLRALELMEGPIDVSRNVRPGRSYSISGFDFQADLLPLSASLSEPDRGSEAGGEKSISLLNGEHVLLLPHWTPFIVTKGIALCVGLQASMFP